MWSDLITSPPLSVRPQLSLTAPHASPPGAERVGLLEAVGREGSISGAARAVGLSYASAWRAILAMNALAGRPLIAALSGGRRGGGARLTSEGMRLVEAFRSLQVAMARAFGTLRARNGGRGRGGGPADAGRGPADQSAQCAAGGVNTRVGLGLSEGQTIFASLTCRSVKDLGLFPGRPAIAPIKAPLVGLVADRPASGVNRVPGTIRSLDPGGDAVEAILDIGGGASLCAVVPGATLAASGLGVGSRAVAVIDPSHVILAVE